MFWYGACIYWVARAAVSSRKNLHLPARAAGELTSRLVDNSTDAWLVNSHTDSSLVRRLLTRLLVQTGANLHWTLSTSERRCPLFPRETCFDDHPSEKLVTAAQYMKHAIVDLLYDANFGVINKSSTLLIIKKKKGQINSGLLFIKPCIWFEARHSKNKR